jgi:hypothetical protein
VANLTYSTRLVLTVAGTILAALLATYAFAASGTGGWLPLGLSIASLCVSILAAFRNDLFDFAPEVIQNGVLLAQASPPTASINIALPLLFLNRGYGDGIIQEVALRLKLASGTEPVIWVAAAEIDLVKFMQGTRRVEAGNVIGPFGAFPLESKKSASKTLLFTLELKPGETSRTLPQGAHRVELFLKTSHRPAPYLGLSFTLSLNEHTLREYQSGKSIHNIDSDIAKRLP